MNKLYNSLPAKRFRPYGFRNLLVIAAFLLLLGVPARSAAQDTDRIVTGEVVDKDGNLLDDVLVDLKESLVSTISDRQGKFSIRVPEKASLIFTLQGYQTQTVILAGNDSHLRITLIEGQTDNDPYVYLPYGKQKRSVMTSAVSYVGGDELEDIPLMHVTAMLAGKLPGVLTIQESGAPRQDAADLYLRGRRSWRNRNPLVFVDGHRRPISQIDAHEIEQITAYKDAGALAIFGLRGGNGAIMATTKRGIEGRPVLSFNSQVSIQSATELPKTLDSWHFATLYNEAQLNDNPNATPRYSPEKLEGYLAGNDPYNYPDVDWIGSFLKKHSVAQKHNMSIRGGSSVAKYYVNLTYQNNNGLYKTDDDINTYKTAANYKMYSVRSNTDVKITNTTSLAINLYGRQFVQNNPGATTNSNEMFNTLFSMAPNMFPIHYGKHQVAGTNEFRKNPYGLLNFSGYSKYIHSSMEASLEIKEKMDYFVEGLTLRGSVAYDLRFDNTINRSKVYKVYQYDGTDPVSGEDRFQIWGEEKAQNNNNSFGSRKIRIFDVEAGLDYARTFGKHDVAATLMYNLNEESDDTKNLPNYHQGVFGRATYVYDSRYIAEFSFGYQGTEQLPPDNRYGFFPAGSIGWIVTNEAFIKGRKINDILSFMKLRASYGLAGNDDGIPYYYYLPSFKLNSSNRYNFGTTGSNAPGWVEDGLFNPGVTWEESLKFNVGIDLGLFRNKLSIGFDWFDERTSQILTNRMSVSSILGMGAGTGPLSNVGKTKNHGLEAVVQFSDRIGDFAYTVGGNLGFARNEIVFNDEQTYSNAYRQTVGHTINAPFGLVADGLYRDQQDLENSPKTSFGTVYPGDIKYRDLNGDGIVDINDQTYLGKGNLAEVNYSFHAGARYKGFDFYVQFAGVTDRQYYVKGVNMIAFTNTSGTGGLLDGGARQYHWDHRYNPGDPSTWDSAKYPRLSLEGRNHNTQTSSFWLENGNFLRLKNLEFGYTLPQQLTKKWYISKLRVFYSGNNLLTWHNMRTLDPESSPDGNNYPVQQIHSVGINIQF